MGSGGTPVSSAEPSNPLLLMAIYRQLSTVSTKNNVVAILVEMYLMGRIL
jgi:hypothetical protein